MTDIDLIKRAADSIGLQYEWHHGFGDALHLTAPDATAIYWNPLRSDADALALAVRLEMDVFVRSGCWTEAVAPMGRACKEPHSGDPLSATRRAIVRAAAAADRKLPNVGINRHCPVRSDDEN